MTEKSITIHYREINDSGTMGNGGRCLSDIITSAMKMKKALLCQDRIYRPNKNEPECYFINDFDLGSDYAFGDFVYFTENQAQKCIAESPEAKKFIIERATAPEGKDFIQTSSYWLAIGNHMFLTLPPHTSPKVLETYLNWLLLDKTQTLRSGEPVIFQCMLSEEEIAKIGKFKKITTRFSMVTSNHPEEDSKSSSMATGMLAGRPKLSSLMEVLNMNSSAKEALNRDIPDGVRLDVQVMITHKGKKADRAEQQPLEEIVSNLPTDSLGIVGENGELSTRSGDIRLHRKVSVAVDTDRDPLPESVRTAMRDTYNHFVEHKSILPYINPQKITNGY